MAGSGTSLSSFRFPHQIQAMLVHDLVPPAQPTAEPFHCLVLHGLGDSKDGWKPVADELALPQLGWCFVQAPVPYYGGWSWFDIYADHRIDTAQQHESRDELRRLVDHLLTRLAIPSERLFIMGFSQGCLMTLDLGLRADRRFAGLVGISGFLTDLDAYPAAFGSAVKQQHLLLTHGLYDGMLPIAAMRRVKDRLLAMGVPLDWREYAKDHGLDPHRELGDLRAFLSRRIAAGVGA
jgi:phospholipase/carboxylesterase